MSRWASPTPAQMREAFNDLKVSWTAHKKVSTGRGPWREGLRAATVHHTAGKNSADYLATIYSLPGANCVINNGQYNGKSVDGRAVILSWGDAWHSGAGGPWSGIASRDSLHRVSWGIEIESMGTRRDITDAQKENVGRMLAALVELGMPLKNIHRHADWTDGTGPVPGPLPTRGRKIDTNKALGYTTQLWVDLAKKYGSNAWDGKVPSLEACERADEENLTSPASWRIACRLQDLGYYKGPVSPKGEQGYPRKAIQNLQDDKGWKVPRPGQWGPKLHLYVFGES